MPGRLKVEWWPRSIQRLASLNHPKTRLIDDIVKVAVKLMMSSIRRFPYNSNRGQIQVTGVRRNMHVISSYAPHVNVSPNKFPRLPRHDYTTSWTAKHCLQNTVTRTINPDDTRFTNYYVLIHIWPAGTAALHAFFTCTKFQQNKFSSFLLTTSKLSPL